jgi:hypothetical protein
MPTRDWLSVPFTFEQFLWKDTKDVGLSSQDLYQRGRTLLQCGIVAFNQHGVGNTTCKDGEESITFHDLSEEYIVGLGNRYHSYLIRHGEWQQFMNEDAAGKRYESK